MKTYVPDASGIEQKWWVVDAEGQTLGRLATGIASVLRGKHRPDFAPHLDLGDHIVVVNAERVAVSTKAREQKKYYRHSGYPGGLSERSLGDMLQRQPERVIKLAVRGMLPGSRLGRQLLRKLKVYSGPEHPHQAQAPEPLEIAAARRPQETE